MFDVIAYKLAIKNRYIKGDEEEYKNYFNPGTYNDMGSKQQTQQKLVSDVNTFLKNGSNLIKGLTLKEDPNSEIGFVVSDDSDYNGLTFKIKSIDDLLAQYDTLKNSDDLKDTDALKRMRELSSYLTAARESLNVKKQYDEATGNTVPVGTGVIDYNAEQKTKRAQIQPITDNTKLNMDMLKPQYQKDMEAVKAARKLVADLSTDPVKVAEGLAPVDEKINWVKGEIKRLSEDQYAKPIPNVDYNPDDPTQQVNYPAGFDERQRALFALGEQLKYLQSSREQIEQRFKEVAAVHGLPDIDLSPEPQSGIQMPQPEEVTELIAEPVSEATNEQTPTQKLITDTFNEKMGGEKTERALKALPNIDINASAPDQIVALVSGQKGFKEKAQEASKVDIFAKPDANLFNYGTEGESIVSYINDPTPIKALAISTTYHDPYDIYNYLTPEEKDTFRYLYATGDTYLFNDFKETITPELEKRQYEERLKEADELSDKSPVIGGVYAGAVAIANTLVSPIAVVEAIENLFTGKKPDPYSIANQTVRASQDYKEIALKHTTGFGRTIGNIAISIAPTVIVGTIAPEALPLYSGAMAAGREAAQQTSNGSSSWQIALQSTITGGVEYFSTNFMMSGFECY